MLDFDKLPCTLSKKVVYLHSVFHSIRFKVNKQNLRGHSGDPFFIS